MRGCDREREVGREGDTNNWGEKDGKRRRRKPGRAEGQDGSCPPLLCSLLSLSGQRKTGRGWKDNARKIGRQGRVLRAAALLGFVVDGLEKDWKRREGESQEERKARTGLARRCSARCCRCRARERLEEERRRKPGRTDGKDGSCPPLLCSLLSLSGQGSQALRSHNSAIGLSPPTTTMWRGAEEEDQEKEEQEKEECEEDEEAKEKGEQNEDNEEQNEGEVIIGGHCW